MCAFHSFIWWKQVKWQSWYEYDRIIYVLARNCQCFYCFTINTSWQLECNGYFLFFCRVRTPLLSPPTKLVVKSGSKSPSKLSFHSLLNMVWLSRKLWENLFFTLPIYVMEQKRMSWINSIIHRKRMRWLTATTSWEVYSVFVWML